MRVSIPVVAHDTMEPIAVQEFELRANGGQVCWIDTYAEQFRH